MKISELTNKNFLNNAGAAANSYVLINYEDNSTNGPVTYKASLDTLGKAIVKNLNLMQNDTPDLSGRVTVKTVDVSQGAYTTGNNTGWSKLNRAAVLSYDPSYNNIVYYDDYHNTGYQTYEQTTLDNAPLVRYNDGSLEYYDNYNNDYQTYEQTTIDDKPIVILNSSGLAAADSNGNYEPITKTDDKEMVLWSAGSSDFVISDGYGGYDTITGIGGYQFAFASDGNLIDGNNDPITKIDNNPLVIYDETSEAIKYYDTTEEEYVTIPTGGNSNGEQSDGYTFFNTSKDTLEYYSASDDDYYEVSMVHAVADNQLFPGPSTAYHLVYGDASAFPLYAIADPWRIPGDAHQNYNLVVCNNNGSLFKVVAPSDSDPYIEALTT